MSVLVVRPPKPRSRSGSKVGVTVYVEDDDLAKLDFLVGRANSNRSDILRQAVNSLYDRVQVELGGKPQP